MPYAMGPKRNTQKPKENLDFSWSGGDRGRTSEAFFRVFCGVGRVVVDFGLALVTLGRTLAALGPSWAALGGHSAPKGSTRVPLHGAAGRGRSATNLVLEP